MINLRDYSFFCEFGLVAITRFLGDTFGQNLVVGVTKTFYRTGRRGSLVKYAMKYEGKTGAFVISAFYEMYIN